MSGDPGEPVVITLVWFLFFHTRLRVQWAPGIPHALPGADGFSMTRAKRAAGTQRCVCVGIAPAVIVRESGRSSIPKTSVIEPKGRGVLDTPHARGMTRRGM